VAQRFEFPNSGRSLWALLFLAIGMVAAVFFLFDLSHAVDFVRTIGNAESSVGLWTRRRYSVLVAFSIAIFAGTYDLFFWFCAGNKIKRSWQNPLQRSYQQLSWMKTSEVMLLAKSYAVGEAIYHIFVPQPGDLFFLENRETFTKDYHFYLPLVMYGFWPGGIWTGVGYTLAFDLNQILAFLMLMLANACKMLAFGAISIVINPWWALLIIGLGLPLLKWQIQKYLKRIFVKTSILQTDPTPL
jgi:hypothetical protein